MNIKQHKMDNDLVNEIEHSIIKVINGASNKLRNQRKEECYIAMPYYFFNLLVEHFLRNGFKSPTGNEITRFGGYEIKPNHELAIVFYHRDYPIYLDPEMISKQEFRRREKNKGDYKKITIDF